MKTFALCGLALAGVAGSAVAGVEHNAGNLTINRVYELGQASSGGARLDAGASYSNITNFTGQAFANGGSQNQSGNTITRMVVDDTVWAGPTLTGQSVLTLRFSVANLNTSTVSARARVRFYLDNGSGAPGNYYTGFTFNALAFGSGVTTVTGSLAANAFLAVAPGTRLWAGIVFDNNNGATGATAAQLDNLGQGIFNPVDIGSSADSAFQTTAAGSFVANNPAGSSFNFNGNPVANFGWEFVVPAPSSLALLGLGGLVAARRRR